MNSNIKKGGTEEEKCPHSSLTPAIEVGGKGQKIVAAPIHQLQGEGGARGKKKRGGACPSFLFLPPKKEEGKKRKEREEGEGKGLCLTFLSIVSPQQGGRGEGEKKRKGGGGGKVLCGFGVA